MSTSAPMVLLLWIHNFCCCFFNIFFFVFSFASSGSFRASCSFSIIFPFKRDFVYMNGCWLFFSILLPFWIHVCYLRRVFETFSIFSSLLIPPSHFMSFYIYFMFLSPVRSSLLTNKRTFSCAWSLKAANIFIS